MIAQPTLAQIDPAGAAEVERLLLAAVQAACDQQFEEAIRLIDQAESLLQAMVDKAASINLH